MYDNHHTTTTTTTTNNNNNNNNIIIISAADEDGQREEGHEHAAVLRDAGAPHEHEHDLHHGAGDNPLDGPREVQREARGPFRH